MSSDGKQSSRLPSDLNHFPTAHAQSLLSPQHSGTESHSSHDQLLLCPNHFGMSGHPDLTAEEIHDLLGGVLESDPSSAFMVSRDNGNVNDECTLARQREQDYGGDDDEDDDDALCSFSIHGRTNSTQNGPEDANDDKKVLLRTERKRYREKQRRSDVNKQFSQLTAVLRRIEAEDPEESRGLPAYSPSNRVELMGRTVQLLTNLFENCKKRKIEVKNLEKELEDARKAGEESAAKLKEAMMAPQNIGNNKVMMMVPMLIGGDGSNNGGAAAPMMHPWMPPFMGMPPPAAVAAAPAQPGIHDMHMASSMHSAAMMMPWMMAPHLAAPTAATATMSQQLTAVSMTASASSSTLSPPMKEDPPSTTLGGNLAHCA